MALVVVVAAAVYLMPSYNLGSVTSNVVPVVVVAVAAAVVVDGEDGENGGVADDVWSMMVLVQLDMAIDTFVIRNLHEIVLLLLFTSNSIFN